MKSDAGARGPKGYTRDSGVKGDTGSVGLKETLEILVLQVQPELKIPSLIANDSGIRKNHISNVLSELKTHELVE